MRIIAQLTLSAIALASPTMAWSQLQDFGQNNLFQRVQSEAQANLSPNVTAENTSSYYTEFLSNKMVAKQIPAQTPSQVFTFVRYNFSQSNSFIGGGLTSTQGTDVGVNYTAPFKLNLIANFSYTGQEGDKPNGSEQDANNYAGEVAVEQQVYDSSTHDPSHPTFAYYVGLDSKYTSSDRTLYAAGTQYKHQDIYDLGPGIRCKVTFSDVFNLSVAAQYAFESVDQRSDASSSSGIFSLTLAPSYSFPTGPPDNHGNVPGFTFLPLLAWKRDTNMEPLPSATSPAPPVLYSNWLSTGLGIGYAPNGTVSFLAKYTYDAFNQTYESHKVSLECHVSF